MSSLKEECGIMGVMGDEEASNLVYLGLYALQHRGQEAAGIIAFETKDSAIQRSEHKYFGLVGDIFSKEKLGKLKGDVSVGHVRYSTHGGKLLQNIQPFSFYLPKLGEISIAHNGNISNAAIIRKELEVEGAIFTTTSDTEVLMHLMARSKEESFKDKIIDAIKNIRGAYSLLITNEKEMFALRDPFGFRPLAVGKRKEAYIVASETCALNFLDVSEIKELKAGEIMHITREGTESFFPLKQKQEAFCSFEPIYFSRPDSTVKGESIYRLRKNMGATLAEEKPAPTADVVVPIPDSGVPMAMGYAQKANITLELGLIRNHYVGRTFIEPSQEIRDFGVKLKLNPIKEIVEGKSVVLIDDSIVRGTTSLKIVRMIKKAGAKEIHLRIAAPPITHSCYYGVDTPNRKKLLAAQKNIQEIGDYIGVDSIGYLSTAGLQKALGKNSKKAYCFACFNGEYKEKIFAEIEPQPTDSV